MTTKRNDISAKSRTGHRASGEARSVGFRFYSVLAAIALLFVSAGLLPAVTISSGGMTAGGIRVTDTSLSPARGEWICGTYVVRLRLENTQPFPQDVRVTFSDLASSARVAAGGSAIVSIPVPAVNGISVYHCNIRDHKGETSFTFHDSVYCSSNVGSSYHSHSGYYSLYGFDDASLYLSSSFSSDDVKTGYRNYLNPSSGSSGHSYSSHSVSVSGYLTVSGSDASTLKATEVSDPWPADWRCYSPFNVCLIADRDYSAIPENGKEALREYVAAGGNVFVAGQREECVKIIRELSGTSFGEMVVNGDLEKQAFIHYGLGSFGYCVAKDFATFATTADKSWYKDAVDRLRDAKSVYNAGFLNDKSKNPYFSIDNSAREKVPSKLFIALLLAFVVLAGPVSIYVLAKKNKRIWLLWVLPSISFVFSAAIILAMLVSEGVTPYSTRDAVTFLGQGDGRAVTIGGISVYSPLSLPGLDFRNDSDVLPLVARDRNSTGEITAGKTLHYGTGWVRPRVPCVFAVRRTDVLRERVEVMRAEDGSIEIVNALGAPLKKITLWDENGAVHVAENVTSGAKVKLQGVEKDADVQIEGRVKWAFNSKYAYNGLESFDIGKKSSVTLQGDMATVNFKCLYAAEIDDGCPFLDDPLADRKHHSEDSALVIGSYGFRSAEKGGANQ